MKKLQKKYILKGIIIAETGLHIGGTNQQMGIGGPDNLVIRNPLKQLPIIPGSSLKGKMRSLLELVKGAYGDKGAVGNKKEITDLFGTSADKDNPDTHASRLIVRDAELSYDDKNPDDVKKWENTDMLYSEAKTEVVINRLTSAATPRTFERVPAGAEFEYEMVVNIVAEDDKVGNVEKALMKLLAEGMELLEMDYLGGNGSRGYGKIKFKDTTIKEWSFNEKGSEEKELKEGEIYNYFKPFMERK